MGRNNGPQSPSMNESDPWAVPFLSQDSAAAAGPELCPPVNSQEPHQDDTFYLTDLDECLLAEDELFGCQIDWDSFTRSRHGATASPSCNNPVSLENQMNGRYAVDSLPQPPHQSEQCDRLLPCMISAEGKTQTSFYGTVEMGSSSSHRLQIEHSMLGSQLPPKVPCTIQDSAAAAESYMDFGPYQDGDMPRISPETLKFLEDCLSKDELVGCRNSGTDWASFAPSRCGATASASCNNSVSLENHMNEEDPADSLPQPLHQDKKGEVSDHAVKRQCSEISDSYKETTVNNDGASRPDTSVDLRNISNSIEMDYNKETSQSERYRVKSFTVPEFFVEVPESASVGFLKKAIREKAIKMVDELLRWENTQFENGFIPKVGTSHQNKLDDGCISSMTATTCSKVVPKNMKRLMMDVNSLDVGNVPQKSKSSQNVKRRKIEPFSISEVEALVQKMEEHGTGRWAKIKEQAFGQDSRRTRLDLRDKWERLLKTAKTPPEKRRGPKIPQELLDRIVAIDKCNSQR